MTRAIAQVSTLLFACLLVFAAALWVLTWFADTITAIAVVSVLLVALVVGAA